MVQTLLILTNYRILNQESWVDFNVFQIFFLLSPIRQHKDTKKSRRFP